MIKDHFRCHPGSILGIETHRFNWHYDVETCRYRLTENVFELLLLLLLLLLLADAHFKMADIFRDRLVTNYQIHFTYGASSWDEIDGILFPLGAFLFSE